MKFFSRHFFKAFFVTACAAFVFGFLLLLALTAAWSPDTLSFSPQKIIKETGAVLERIYVRGDTIRLDLQESDSVYVNMGNARIQNIANARKDDEAAGWGQIKKHVRDSTTTVVEENDFQPQEISIPTSANAPTNNVRKGRLYYDTTIDSLRTYNGTEWRSVGARGDGYFEKITYSRNQGIRITTSEGWPGRCIASPNGIGNPAREISCPAPAYIAGNTVDQNLITMWLYCRFKGNHDINSWTSANQTFRPQGRDTQARITQAAATAYPTYSLPNPQGFTWRNFKRPFGVPNSELGKAQGFNASSHLSGNTVTTTVATSITCLKMYTISNI